MKKLPLTILILILALNLVSAVVLNSVNSPTFNPSQEGQIRIELENIFNDDAIDVSLRLNFQGLPFIPIGSSEQTTDEIQEDDDEVFIFIIKASPDIKPGDYEIPYTLEFELDGKDRIRTGTIGIKVTSNPKLTYTLDSNNAIIGQKSQLSLKIINKGFADARFVSIKVIPTGVTLLSTDEIYIGEIESDDFETANFDIVPTNTKASFLVLVEYKDFENNLIRENVELKIKVYTKEQAQAIGLTSQSNLGIIIGIIITLILLWILWRTLRKVQRLKKSAQR